MTNSKERKNPPRFSLRELLHSKGMAGTMFDPAIPPEIKTEFQKYISEIHRLKNSCSSDFFRITSALIVQYGREPTYSDLLPLLDRGLVAWMEQNRKTDTLLTQERKNELQSQGIEPFDVFLREWDNWYDEWKEWFEEYHPEYFA